MHSAWRLIPVSAIILSLQGCSWFHDDRPPPQGAPYETTGEPARKQILSEAEAVKSLGFLCDFNWVGKAQRMIHLCYHKKRVNYY